MATAAQVLANRENARQSTGPRTAEGKQRSAANATKHGLSSAFTVLPDESQEEFDALAHQFRAEYQPQGEHQHFLIDQMIQARWRIARINRLEDAALCQMMDSGATVDVRALATFQRYRTAAERSYYKAQTEMHNARQQRHENTAIVNMDNYMVRLMNAKSPRNQHDDQHQPEPVSELRNEANSNLALRL
jgi:hypothetical protein